MDSDASGTLGADELRVLLQEHGDYEDEAGLDSMLRAMDLDRDGFVDFSEAMSYERGH
jgi:Ca2+-binding EF-hand superfamily protein